MESIRILAVRRAAWRAILAAPALVLTLTLAPAWNAPAGAQVLYGGLVGTVRDTTGAAVPGATVTATNHDTGLTLETTSGERGTYSIINVLPGSYDVGVSLPGFKEFSRTGVPVTAATISRIDVRLEVGELTEQITVASAAQLLQTDKADVHAELKSIEIANLPLPNYRNYQSLLNLVPGTTPGQFQNALSHTPARSLRTHVNGQNPNNNATKLDGATNVNVWVPHHVVYVAPAETIDTVNISTNNFDAEQGMAGGAAITVITKSGTNDLSGSAFGFFNNEQLNAKGFFDPEKPESSRTIAGGTLGGPIVRNRLFFFGSWEGQFERNPGFRFYDVPTDEFRRGDFSGAVDTAGNPQIIYDPMTGNADGTGRQPFPGNRIPEDRLDPIARLVQQLYPEPNTPGVTRNYVTPANVTMDRNNYDLKINLNVSSRQQLWGKLSVMDASVRDLFYLGIDEPGGGDNRVYVGTAGSTWTVSPTLVVDATAGFTRQTVDIAAGDFALGRFGMDVLGLPGTNHPADDRYNGMPTFAAGFSALGSADSWTPAFYDERTFTAAVNVTKLAGEHDLRAGYLTNFLFLDHWQPEIANPRGAFSFNGNPTALAGGQAPNFYNQYANFLLGLPTSISKSLQYEEMTGREWQHALYVRDRWQVSPQVTLDLGVRWELYPLMRRADRGLERVDLDTMDVLLGGLGGNPTDVGLRVDKSLIAPRLGVIYRLNDESVVRAGFGRTYNPLPFSRPLRGFYPLTIASSFVAHETYGWFDTLEAGIPAIEGPDLASGRVPLPPTVQMRTPEPDNIGRGHIDSWNLAVERQLPANLSVNVAYVGTRGRDGYGDVDINASDTPGLGVAGRPLFESTGRAIGLSSWGGRLRTEYHALQVAVNRPFSDGLLVKGAYTWSKAMNEADEDGWVGLTWNGASQLNRNYALAGYDRTHNLQLGLLYQLPFARDEGASGLVGALVRDWQVNGIFSIYSGTPFTVGADGGALAAPGNTQTADQIAEPTKVGQVGDAGVWYDPSAWQQPEGVRYGNSGRNSIRGPSQWNLDLSIFRAFRLGQPTLEIRAEAFNLTNTPKLGNPNTFVLSPNFMQIHNVTGARQIRLGTRLSW